MPKDSQSHAARSLPATALVHDWLTGMRGGEKVLQSLCVMYPDAPIWTTLYVKGTVSELIADRPIHTSPLQHMPAAAEKYRYYLPLYPIFAEANKADASRLIVSTSHAVAKSMVKRRRNGPLHICYIHTPMRYAWDLFEEYFGVERKGWLLSTLIYKPVLSLIRYYDRSTVSRVDLFVANSSYIAERVKRIYGRDALVLPPPVDIDRFVTLQREPEEWYLIVSALVTYKRVEDAIYACHRYNRQLKIVGKGPDFDALAALVKKLNAPIELLGPLDDEELADHYRRARALLFPGIEDFGIVPVEAIAAGCPVIGYAKGGLLDSMTDKTAVFYHDQTVDSLLGGMEEFEGREQTFSVAEMRDRARTFSEEQFRARFAKIVEDALKSSGQAAPSI